jgi:hypothetical protein
LVAVTSAEEVVIVTSQNRSPWGASSRNSMRTMPSGWLVSTPKKVPRGLPMTPGTVPNEPPGPNTSTVMVWPPNGCTRSTPAATTAGANRSIESAENRLAPTATQSTLRNGGVSTTASLPWTTSTAMPGAMPPGAKQPLFVFASNGGGHAITPFGGTSVAPKSSTRIAGKRASKVARSL